MSQFILKDRQMFTIDFILNIFLLHLVAIGFACHALLKKRDPRSALGWTVTLLFLPVGGLIIYLIFGIGRAHSRAEKIMRQLSDIETRFNFNTICNDHSDLGSYEANNLARIAGDLSGAPLCAGNSIQALHNGDEAYPAMIEAINNASRHVFLSTYIFNYGYVAQKFISALHEAHNRGVDVRVLVDGVGALYSWKKPWRILKSLGVPTTRFRPFTLFPPNFGINLRSHRKVLVCDKIGFTGGMNIADNDMLRLNPEGRHHIQDVQFRCEGPIVNQLRRAFLLNWAFCTNQITRLKPIDTRVAGDCHCRVIVDGPGNDSDALLDTICNGINMAKNTVRIMTPYFLPPSYLYEALRSAGQRGVDTRVVLPAKNNLDYMSWAMERILPGLLKAGVRVFYQPPPFAHTKLLALDGYYTLMGSANMDSRSLLLNFELNMEIYNRDFHNQIARFIDNRINAGKEITLEYFKTMPLLKKLRNSASWIFSPYF